MNREVVTPARDLWFIVPLVFAVLGFGALCFVQGRNIEQRRSHAEQEAQPLYMNGSTMPWPGPHAYRDMRIGDGTPGSLLSVGGDFTLEDPVSDTLTVNQSSTFADVVLDGPHWLCSLTDTVPRRTECHDYSKGPKR